MSKMISVASGFQYSVNIGYDLNNDDKRTATKTCDAVVKKSKDGKYNVYENKITKVS